MTLDPIAAIEWGVLNLTLHDSGGHCFGISRAVQRLVSHKEPYAAFTTGHSVFSIPSAAGPDDFLNSYLDAEHALQASDEFLHEWYLRDKSLDAQLETLKFEVAQDKEPIVTLQSGSSGHAVLAYGERNTATGIDIDVYDNNRPFTPVEETNGAIHKAAEDASVIHVDTATKTWTFGSMHGTGESLFVAPDFTIPDNPSLPGITTLEDDLASVVFGSPNGSVRTVGGSPGAEYLPPLDNHAQPGTAGWWVSRNNGHPFHATFEGLNRGSYDEAYATPGFVGSVSDVATSKGVRDTVTGMHNTLTFAGGSGRALKLELAQRPNAASAEVHSATLLTHASANGSDTAGLTPRGVLSYTHDGAPTIASFNLTTIRRDGGPSNFASGPVAVRRGDHITATLLERDTATVRLQIRDSRGHTITRMLRNRMRPPAYLRITGLKLNGATATARVRISALRTGATLGLSLRLLRGARDVARYAKAVKASNAVRAFTWRTPRVRAGRYRLLADARVITHGGRGVVVATGVSGHRSAVVTRR